jgi:virginiamycin A acetyltransferase
VTALLEIAWWDWEADKITRNLEHIMAADPNALRSAR